jgi:hypothetical protein
MKRIATGLLCCWIFCSANAQSKVSIKVDKIPLTIDVGQSLPLNARVVDENNRTKEERTLRYFSRKRRAVSVDSTGLVTGILPGEYSLIIISPASDGNVARVDIPVIVNYPPISRIEILDFPSSIYENTNQVIRTKVTDAANLERINIDLEYSSRNPEIASVDMFGNVLANKKGKTTISVKKEAIATEVTVMVVENPTAKVALKTTVSEARAGDVIKLEATTTDKSGKKLTDIPVYFSFEGRAFDVSSTASGLIQQDGRFVAEEPGMYTLIAKSGNFADQKTIRIIDRGVQRKVERVGKGSVANKHTSDFWIWEGLDGRDYGVTGTWGADGTAYFWDVTDPSDIVKIDSIQVDARTVNDVKVSEDGKICIISREGASNRKNGIVILDVSNPRDVSIISTFTENLTGGVHNLFISKNHVYALSAGQKYYSINIEDPRNPKIAGKFELDTPGHSIHDVWIEDGIAYSSNWGDGVQLVDVGNGIAGGTPDNPVQFASYAYPSGANHATFPYRSKSTGKFYVFAGDEIFPYGLNLKGANVAGGFIHIIDFTDLENPVEVARFEVPGAGSHNLWIENDMLYVAFYNGGVRVVDISGELMGDLFNQGREVGWLIPGDPDGFVPNAPFTWGAQPYKGHIYISDWNSGLWAVRLEPEKPKETQIQSK